MGGLLSHLLFTEAGMLVALASLPIFYLLIRLLPPRPQKRTFPALNLLKGLEPKNPPPKNPPWWLLLLRLGMVVLLTVGLAGPLWRKAAPLAAASHTPLVIMLDNGWASGNQWQTMVRHAGDLIQQAQASHRQVMLLPTAPETHPFTPALQTPASAADLLKNLKPEPWPTDRLGALKRASQVLGNQTVHTSWLSDGLIRPQNKAALLQAIGTLGPADATLPGSGKLPLTITGAGATQNGYTVQLHRPAGAEGAAATFSVSLYDMGGHFITRGNGSFKAGAADTTAQITLPDRLSGPGYFMVDGQTNAGAWRGLGSMGGLPHVALVGDSERDYPLLDPTYYIKNALADGFAPQNLHDASDLTGVDVLFLTRRPLNPEKIKNWVGQGGVLVSFAGPWLTGDGRHGVESLLPLPLRATPRALAGPLSWTGALSLGKINPASPLADMGKTPLPTDIHITQQLLPENSLDSAHTTWLSLSDGTPLVSGKKVGRGYSVVIHVDADARWSNLPLSGFFVQLLQNLAKLGQKQAPQAIAPGVVLTPYKVLSGTADLTPRSAGDQTADSISAVGPGLPPGFYGPATLPFALNLNADQLHLAAIGASGLQGIPTTGYSHVAGLVRLAPWFLVAALLLLLVDSVWRSGLLKRLPFKAASSALLLGLMLAPAAHAQGAKQGLFPLDAYGLRLAYLPSGDPHVDAVTRRGLDTLSQVLGMRTTVDPQTPAKALSLGTQADVFSLYPMIYWPISPHLPLPTKAQAAKLRTFMDHGGLLVIDSATDAGSAQGLMPQLLNDVLGATIRELPEKHVLNRTFYLMRGTWAGREGPQPVWIDATRHIARLVVLHENMAGAWAFGPNGKPLEAVTPGGEQQRETAYRGGINLVMYALLGDYKDDQIHINALLQRMGGSRP